MKYVKFFPFYFLSIIPFRCLYIISDKTLTPIFENLAESNGDGTVSHSLDKIPAQKWNMLVGVQYQINKYFQVRAEGGFIGRQAFLISFNYRFGIPHIK